MTRAPFEPHNSTAFPNPHDYENKYPADPAGEELGPTARVWRAYLDEAKKFDDELLASWKDTTDTLLIFVCAGITAT